MFLVSCASAPKDTGAASEKTEATVFQPEYSDFLYPEVSRLSNGEWAPYTATVNPYTKLPEPDVSAEIRQAYADGLQSLESKDYTNARNQFLSITKAQPALSGPWLQLGNLAIRQERWSDAEDFFTQAIDANDWNTHAWLGLGIVQRQQGNMEEAAQSYREALKRWPDFARAHRNLAILLDLYLNDAESAQAHYEAYQILTGFEDEQANDWVTEISRRTGIDRAMPVFKGSDPAVRKSSDVAGDSETDGGDR